MSLPAPDVIPTFSYRDAGAAIEWLQDAFGFERHAVHEDDDGKVVHAELRLGSGMIMLGSARESEAWPSKAPGELGGATGGTYVIVDDVDAHYERAIDAGAQIIKEPTDQDYGGRDYTARDPEGYLWSFGTYRPGLGRAAEGG